VGKEGDGGGDERDYRRRAEEGENHEDEDDGAVAAHDGLIFVGEVARKDGGEDFLTIKRIDGDEIEDGQGDIQNNDGVKKGEKVNRQG